MALIKCKECGYEVSEKANSCPKCGAPSLAAEKIQKVKAGALSGCALILAAPLVLIVGFVVFALLAAILSK